MKRQLYYSPGACSLAPHVLLEEAGLQYELVLASVTAGDTRADWFLRVNPKARVPVLVEDGQVLTELPAICWHVALQATRLVPGTALAQARALEWFNWLSGTVHGQGFGALWRPARFTRDSALHPALAQQARATIEESFDSIEARLGESRWALGGAYSLVDPFLFVMYRWGYRIGLPMPVRYPAWTNHTRSMLERGAVCRALQQENLDQGQWLPAMATSAATRPGQSSASVCSGRIA